MEAILTSRLITVAVFTVAIVPCFALATGATWEYSGKEGPSHWKRDYPLCKGKHQSPININTGRLTCTECRPLEFDGLYDDEKTMTIENNGHTVGLLTPPGYELSGGCLDGTYEAMQFHFHWGSHDGMGSEHSVNGHFYDAEMHIVYKKKDLAKDDAMKAKDGIAVVSVLIEVGDEDNPSFDPIIKGVKEVPNPSDKSVTPEAFSLGALLPINQDEFYRYNGSFTTPPCYESVVWTIFTEPNQISQSQLDAFRDVYNPSHHHLVDNERPVQKLHGRTVLLVNPSLDSYCRKWEGESPDSIIDNPETSR